MEGQIGLGNIFRRARTQGVSRAGFHPAFRSNFPLPSIAFALSLPVCSYYYLPFTLPASPWDGRRHHHPNRLLDRALPFFLGFYLPLTTPPRDVALMQSPTFPLFSAPPTKIRHAFRSLGMLKAFALRLSTDRASRRVSAEPFTSASCPPRCGLHGHRTGRWRPGDAFVLKSPRRHAPRAGPCPGCLQGPCAGALADPLTEMARRLRCLFFDGGLFEPLVDLGAEVKAGHRPARIHFGHHTPWREPDLLAFSATGWCCASACRRAASAATCLFHLRRISDGSHHDPLDLGTYIRPIHY